MNLEQLINDYENVKTIVKRTILFTDFSQLDYLIKEVNYDITLLIPKDKIVFIDYVLNLIEYANNFLKTSNKRAVEQKEIWDNHIKELTELFPEKFPPNSTEKLTPEYLTSRNEYGPHLLKLNEFKSELEKKRTEIIELNKIDEKDIPEYKIPVKEKEFANEIYKILYAMKETGLITDYEFRNLIDPLKDKLGNIYQRKSDYKKHPIQSPDKIIEFIYELAQRISISGLTELNEKLNDLQTDMENKISKY